MYENDKCTSRNRQLRSTTSICHCCKGAISRMFDLKIPEGRTDFLLVEFFDIFNHSPFPHSFSILQRKCTILQQFLSLGFKAVDVAVRFAPLYRCRRISRSGTAPSFTRSRAFSCATARRCRQPPPDKRSSRRYSPTPVTFMSDCSKWVASGVCVLLSCCVGRRGGTVETRPPIFFSTAFVKFCGRRYETGKMVCQKPRKVPNKGRRHAELQTFLKEAVSGGPAYANSTSRPSN